MTPLTDQQKHAIQRIVTPDRARFDLRERHIYSHDTGVLPGAFRLLAGPSLADGVVQPTSEDQVVQLVRYARAERIALVPRGKGTSGYGGAVPAQGGLVLDVTHLKGVIRADARALTVTVGAGTVWKDLEECLAIMGLALRMYPTSAPASTVAGWLAQGGAGIGSHAYGWFADNVRAARVVTGTGEVRELTGDDVRSVADAEGTTGIITEVTLEVREATQLEQVAIAFKDPESLARALVLIAEQRLPIWSISFLSPSLVQLKNAGPPKIDAGGDPEPCGARLPEDAYVAVVAFDIAASELVVSGLRDICAPINGRQLPAESAHDEWASRFKPMRLKRLGPSLVPIEVVVPASKLAEVLRDLDRAINAPLAIEGLSIRGEEVLLLGFIPHDERTLGYTFGYGFALSAIRIAEKHGGRACSTGRYFGSRAEQVLGRDKVEALKQAKMQNDPDGILNPGKVIFGNGPLGTAIRLAAAAEPLVRTLANVFGRPATPMERAAPNKRVLPEVAGHALACAQCGYCVDICPQFQGDGWESSGPRGKWFFVKTVLNGGDRFDNAMTDVFGACERCGKCDDVCQLDLPILTSWGQLHTSLLRGILTRTS
jgi:FAD/FMN-containing dehydrogenase/ferredoxin